MDKQTKQVDKRSLVAAKGLAEVAASVARKAFGISGQVEALSLIVMNRVPTTGERLAEPEIALFPMQQLIQQYGKAAAPAAQRRICELCDAAAHIFVFEAWRVTLDQDKQFDDMSMGISNHPDRVEVVSILLEHRDGTIMNWEMVIERSGEKAKLGPLVEMEWRCEGAFVGVLNKQAPVVET